MGSSQPRRVKRCSGYDRWRNVSNYRRVKLGQCICHVRIRRSEHFSKLSMGTFRSTQHLIVRALAIEMGALRQLEFSAWSVHNEGIIGLLLEPPHYMRWCPAPLLHACQGPPLAVLPTCARSWAAATPSTPVRRSLGVWNACSYRVAGNRWGPG